MALGIAYVVSTSYYRGSGYHPRCFILFHCGSGYCLRSFHLLLPRSRISPTLFLFFFVVALGIAYVVSTSYYHCTGYHLLCSYHLLLWISVAYAISVYCPTVIPVHWFRAGFAALRAKNILYDTGLESNT